MGIGDFLAGAGDVSRGMRNAEQQEHLARMRQQAVQEENRRVAERREAGRAGIAVGDTPIEVPSFIGQGAGTAAPIGPASGPGKLTPEQLAQARQNLPPDDYAVLAYGQSAATPAPPHAGVATPGQQPAQPTAQPTTEPHPTAPTSQPLAGLAAPAPAPAPWQPAPRGPDGMAIVPDPREPRPGVQSVATPPPAETPAGAKGNVFAPALKDITAEQFSKMSPAEQQRYVAMENAYRVTTRAGKTILSIPTAAPRDVVRFGYDSYTALARWVGLDDFARSIGLMDPAGEERELYQDGGLKNLIGMDRMRRERSPLTAAQLAEELKARGSKPAAEQKPAEEQKAVEAEIKDVPKGPAGTALQGQVRAGVSESKGGSKAAEPVSPSVFYESNTKSLLADRHRLDSDYQRMREVLLKRAQAAGRYGNVENLQQLEMSVAMLDEQYKTNAMMLEGMAAVKMFEYNDDPSTLGQVMSHYLDGTPVGFNRRDDGQWDLFIGEGNYNGTYSKGDISHMVKQFIDVNYRETTAASMSEAAMLHLKNQLETNLALTKIEAETLQKVIIESMRTRRALAMVELGGERFSVHLTQDGEAIRLERGSGEVIFVDPRFGQVEKGPGGMQIQVPPTTRNVDFNR